MVMHPEGGEMFRQRPVVKEIRPHPDPRKEIQLHRIRSLQLLVAQKEQLVRTDYDEIAKMRAHVAKYPADVGVGQRKKLVELLTTEIARLEGEIFAAHDIIAEHVEPLDDIDLSYLMNGANNVHRQ